MIDQAPSSLPLAERFQRILYPTEDDRYKAYFKEEWWSLEEFTCLMAGTIPEVSQGVFAKDEKYLNPKNLERALQANKIYIKFLDDLIDGREGEHLVDKEKYTMSAWRYMKWAAMKGLPMKQRFVDALPLTLLEIYLEFTAENSPLHTKPKSSLAYHKALYLKAARRLMNKYEYRLSRDEIYDDPYMQNVLRQIRAYGGHYIKRTIKNSWLATLEKRKKGRPKKGEKREE